MGNVQVLNQCKGNNSCIKDAILTKLDTRHHVMMVHIVTEVQWNSIYSFASYASNCDFKSIKGQESKGLLYN